MQLIREFRELLTGGANDALIEAARELERAGDGPVSADNLVAVTKPWRGNLWRAFHEIADRLDPVAAHTKARQRDAVTD